MKQEDIVDSISKEEIGDILFNLIRPYYKGITHDPYDPPAFRRSLRPQELDTLLNGIHTLVFNIKLEERIARELSKKSGNHPSMRGKTKTPNANTEEGIAV